MSKIVIIGSISMDLVMETDRIAEAGETVFGKQFSMVPGGKGANQAVAIGRLSSKDDHIEMLGAVGQDQFGPSLLDNLNQNRVISENVGTIPYSTGVAQITLYDDDNRIIYYPGANGEVDASQFDSEWDIIKSADLVVLQNEISHSSNLAIAQFCHQNGVKVLYNPAPSRDTDIDMLDFVDVFTPNEHEVKELFPNHEIEDVIKHYPNKLLVTLGTRGSIFFDGKEIQKVPAIKAEVVDTTGAGDTFNGAFGYALSKGMSFKDAVAFGTLASHLSVQGFGAQGGMPYLEDMKESGYYEETWVIE
ncbi:ribokinase [Streptococcus pluranimalium]|uniref:ribokinase n=1 Tax=Streptococcus pluranimalium TaxID=82348 RepID=UPI002414E1D9|nr:ribokinase [Streptococcus pluranimalium]WFM80322.1 ribokinase [Streptococcus pluranimalium]